MTTPAPIGALRHRLVLERAALADDGSTVWTAVDTLFAAISPVSGGEAELGGGVGGRLTHRLETRFRADLSSRDRLTLGDRVFRILAVRDPDERRARLLIDAEEENR
ncbi:MAG: phage head closure protein [Phyllobacteriaceae bacterium]|nr:phage head closure protein [Phyllobacteriaceae bacterium]